MVPRLDLHDPLLDQLIEGKEIRRHVVLELAPSLYWIILEGCDFGLELLVGQSQLLLLLEDIFVIEGHLLPLAIGLLMLFLNLLSHLVEHPKEMVFTLMRWLDTCD